LEAETEDSVCGEECLKYTVKQLSDMAGVSVRTLHHYDAIALLKPDSRSAAGYRLYGDEQLLRLQQILFFRELDMTLEEIRELLDRPGFDQVAALEEHRRLLALRGERIARLVATVDRTIGRLKGETMLTDEELYEGFSREEIESMKLEAKSRWGVTPAWAESQKRVAAMSKERFREVGAEGEAIDAALGDALAAGEAPSSPAVQALMRRKAEWLRAFYEPSAELFKGLGEMYSQDERFRARYETIRKGLADFVRLAMAEFADSGGLG